MDKNTLGILVSAVKYGELAARLAEAALKAGKQVRIHVLDRAMDVVTRGMFAHLGQQVRIQVCGSSSNNGKYPETLDLPNCVTWVSAERLFASLGNCQRHVVL